MGRQKSFDTKKYSVNLSSNALRNIDEITGYIAFIEHQPANAIKVGDVILETISRIEQHPYAFKECNELKTKSKMYRSAICASWHIIYKIISTNITILGIIHNSRRPSVIKQLKKAK